MGALSGTEILSIKAMVHTIVSKDEGRPAKLAFLRAASCAVNNLRIENSVRLSG